MMPHDVMDQVTPMVMVMMNHVVPDVRQSMEQMRNHVVMQIMRMCMHVNVRHMVMMRVMMRVDVVHRRVCVPHVMASPASSSAVTMSTNRMVVDHNDSMVHAVLPRLPDVMNRLREISQSKTRKRKSKEGAEGARVGRARVNATGSGGEREGKASSKGERRG